MSLIQESTITIEKKIRIFPFKRLNDNLEKIISFLKENIKDFNQRRNLIIHPDKSWNKKVNSTFTINFFNFEPWKELVEYLESLSWEITFIRVR